MKKVTTREQQTHIRIFKKDKEKLNQIVQREGLASIAFAVKKIIRRK